MSDSLKHIRVSSPLGKVASYIKLAMKLPFILREFQPDILISHYISTRGIIAFLSGFKPQLVVINGSDIYRGSRILKPLVYLVLYYADLITVKDNTAKKFILSQYSSIPYLSDRIVVKLRGFVGNTFNLEIRGLGKRRTDILNEIGIGNSSKCIFSPRCMRPVYNQEKILRAFSLIKHNHPEYKLIMLYCKKPDMSYVEKLRKLERRLGIGEDVVWIKRVLQATEMADLFSHSEVFINVPKSDQLAASLTEGIACGSFPIASNLPPYGKVIDDNVNGFLVEPKPNQISKAFDRFISNKDYYLASAWRNAERIREIVGSNDEYLEFIVRLAERLTLKFQK